MTDEERHALAERNLGLVGLVLSRTHPEIIRRIGGREEAYAVGCLALAIAARDFDGSMGFRFSTYACASIRFRLLSASRRGESLIRRPTKGQRKEMHGVGLKSAEPVLARHCDSLAGVEQVDLHEGLERAVERLPDAQSRVVRLVYLEGLSCADVARRIGLSRQAVCMRLKRALQSLREEGMERLMGWEGSNGE